MPSMGSPAKAPAQTSIIHSQPSLPTPRTTTPRHSCRRLLSRHVIPTGGVMQSLCGQFSSMQLRSRPCPALTFKSAVGGKQLLGELAGQPPCVASRGAASQPAPCLPRPGPSDAPHRPLDAHSQAADKRGAGSVPLLHGRGGQAELAQAAAHRGEGAHVQQVAQVGGGHPDEEGGKERARREGGEKRGAPGGAAAHAAAGGGAGGAVASTRPVSYGEPQPAGVPAAFPRGGGKGCASRGPPGSKAATKRAWSWRSEGGRPGWAYAERLRPGAAPQLRGKQPAAGGAAAWEVAAGQAGVGAHTPCWVRARVARTCVSPNAKAARGQLSVRMQTSGFRRPGPRAARSSSGPGAPGAGRRSGAAACCPPALPAGLPPTRPTH